MELSFCTYNMGMEAKHYGRLLKYHGVEGKTVSDYRVAEENSAAILADLADVFFLQGVGSSASRPLIQSLKERNYKIIEFEKAGLKYTAIAFSNDRFIFLKNLSFIVGIKRGSRDVAVAVVVEKNTYRKFAFASLYVPGFSFKDYPALQTTYGDVFLDAAVETIDELEADITVVGADMNNQPNIHPAPFRSLKARGFSIKKVKTPTHINVSDHGVYPERESDYFFVKSELPVTYGLGLVKEMDVTDGHSVCEVNPSDHTPVFMTLKKDDSFWVKIWNLVASFFN